MTASGEFWQWDITTPSFPVDESADWAELYFGESFLIARNADGEYFGQGVNDSGQLGIDTMLMPTCSGCFVSKLATANQRYNFLLKRIKQGVEP